MIVPFSFFFFVEFFVFIMELFVDPYSDQKACGSDLMYLMPLPYPTDIHSSMPKGKTAFMS